MEKQNRPDEAAVRADLTRRLSEVTIDYLALRWGAFYGDTPEPTERDVNEYYRQHAGNSGAGTNPSHVGHSRSAGPGPGRGASELQNWESRMRGRADSLANAVRKGASLETLAPSFGSLQTVELGKNETPPNWRGVPRRSGDFDRSGRHGARSGARQAGLRRDPDRRARAAACGAAE